MQDASVHAANYFLKASLAASCVDDSAKSQRSDTLQSESSLDFMYCINHGTATWLFDGSMPHKGSSTSNVPASFPICSSLLLLIPGGQHDAESVYPTSDCVAQVRSRVHGVGLQEQGKQVFDMTTDHNAQSSLGCSWRLYSANYVKL